MPFLLAVLLLLPVGIQAQEPGFFVVVGSDTAKSIAYNAGPQLPDTLTVKASVGDTIRFKIEAVNFPLINGYFMDIFHEGRVKYPPNPRPSEQYLSVLNYDYNYFLSNPGLPTTQQGLVYLNSHTLQLGVTSLGERSGSGSGLLGFLSVVVDTSFAETLKFEINGIGLQIPRGSTARDSIRARIKIYIPGVPPPPKPITADFNENGIVDFQDFVIFAQQFGRQVSRDLSFNSRIDLIENGSIDFDDFLLFASEFGKPARIIRQPSSSTK